MVVRSPRQEHDLADAHPGALKSVLESANPRMDSEGASGCTWSTARATAPSPGRPTPGVVKQDKSSGGSVDTTKTRSGPRRVRMSGGERPIGAAKGKQSDTEALYQPPCFFPFHPFSLRFGKSHFFGMEPTDPCNRFITASTAPATAAPPPPVTAVPPPPPFQRSPVGGVAHVLPCLPQTQTRKFKEATLKGLCDRLKVRHAGSAGPGLHKTLHGLVLRVLPATVVQQREKRGSVWSMASASSGGSGGLRAAPSPKSKGPAQKRKAGQVAPVEIYVPAECDV